MFRGQIDEKIKEVVDYVISKPVGKSPLTITPFSGMYGVWNQRLIPKNEWNGCFPWLLLVLVLLRK